MNDLHAILELIGQALRAHGCRVTPSRKSGWNSTCPVCRQKRKTLSVFIARDGDRVVPKCFRGCTKFDIIAALDLKMATLYCHLPDRDRVRSNAIVAQYDYVARNGVLVAQKVRTARKLFWWRSPRKIGGWVKGLQGAEVGLYKAPELNAAVIYLVEGEKSANALWSLGLPATCSPNGALGVASQWKPAWTAILKAAGCRRLVICPDADPAGAAHAESVATALNGSGIAIQVIVPPGLALHANAVDGLGGSVDALLTHIAASPMWSPGSTERGRKARRKQYQAAWVRAKRLNSSPDRVLSTEDVNRSPEPPSDRVLSTPSAYALKCRHVDSDSVFTTEQGTSLKQDPGVPALQQQLGSRDLRTDPTVDPARFRDGWVAELIQRRRR